MVQLKVKDHCTHANINKISIPYGSIKRIPALQFLNFYPAFQFLMVQLKEAPEDDPGAGATVFQFLMVQLKESVISSLNRSVLYFNSLWFN